MQAEPHRQTLKDSIILSTDSYKMTHWKMYPPGTRRIGSYFESRAGGEYDHTCFFGLQYVLDRHLAGVRVTEQAIGEAEELCRWHFGRDTFNRKGWEYILDAHGGRLPISIRAVPEGITVPASNVLLTVENTDDEVPWLTNHIESILVQLWYPCTVATISRVMRIVLEKKLELTGATGPLPYMLHDFGFRGSTGMESAAIGGAAHLINFRGTDNLPAVRLLADHYDAPAPGVSVPAAEHSTITLWGREREADAYRHILEQYPDGTVSVVSDSWDIINACRNIWGGELKKEIDGNPGRRVVIRPDSGDPLEIIPECLRVLGKRFGFVTNDKGYKVLPNYIRLLQGDGISRQSMLALLDAIIGAGWAVENLIFGSGGGLLQDCNRDTLKFALKCNWADIGGRTVDVCKRPASDPGKNSKAGKLKLVASSKCGYETVGINDGRPDVLREVFRDGKIFHRTALDEIRHNAMA